MNGFLILDKPEGLTSAQCVYKLRSKLGIKKIGHCGTLDPLATGLLPVCIGEATKFSNFASDLDKVYEVGIEFGIETNTGDITGNIVSKTDFLGFKDDFPQFLTDLEGIQNQIPPKASAVKVNGKRAYSILRENKNFSLDSKKVFLKSITYLFSNKNTSSFEIDCGKGFYVRSLARDIAYKLGTYGHVVELKRTKVGQFTEKSSILLDDILKIGQSEFEFNCIHSSISMLDDILAYEVEEKKDLNDLSLGKSIFINKKKLIKKPLNSDKEELVFLSKKGKIISFGKLSEDLFKPNKVLI